MKKLSKKEWEKFLLTLEINRKTGQLPFWKNFLASFDNQNEPYEVIYPDLNVYLLFLQDVYQAYCRKNKYVSYAFSDFDILFEDYMNRLYPVKPVEVEK